MAEIQTRPQAPPPAGLVPHPHRLGQAQAQAQGQGQGYASNPEDVEYGIDTRPETLATSYYGGMADVSYFRPSDGQVPAIETNEDMAVGPQLPS